MSNNPSLKVVVAENSVIIRSGIIAVLKRLSSLNIHPIEVSSPEGLQGYIHMHTPDILIVNPTFGGWFDLPAFKAENSKGGIRYVAIVSTVIDINLLKEYDEQISICDDQELINSKINHLLCNDVTEEEGENEQEALSQREKEIITCVVKGMTNKAIADQLFLSIHTVITHRRNIARKLQIHSPAGLTIYAIVNKLVEIQDIKETL